MPSEDPDLLLNLPPQDWKLKLLWEDPEFKLKSKLIELLLKLLWEDQELKLNWSVQDLLLKMLSEDQESKLILQLKAPSEDQELRPKSKLQESEDYIIPTFDFFGSFIWYHSIWKPINLILKDLIFLTEILIK